MQDLLTGIRIKRDPPMVRILDERIKGERLGRLTHGVLWESRDE
jgi:hypothetical protein